MSDVEDAIGGNLHNIFEYEEAESESDIPKKIESCPKNNIHSMFKSVKTFGLKDLDEEFRDQALLDMVQSLADQTVKIKSWASQESSAKKSDRMKLKLGTGRIRRLVRYNKGKDKYGHHYWQNCTSCPCGRCAETGNVAPSDVWWEIQIMTAKHVVYDEKTGNSRDALCFLFYDEDDDVNVQFQFQVKRIVYEDNVRDCCELICETCDPNIAARLTASIQQYDNLWPIVRSKFGRATDKLVIIISHPHGGPKKISIGRMMDRMLEGDSSSNLSKIKYNNSTCPGSSGALVLTVGLVCSRFYYHHLHSGFDGNLGCSGTGEEEFIE